MDLAPKQKGPKKRQQRNPHATVDVVVSVIIPVQSSVDEVDIGRVGGLLPQPLASENFTRDSQSKKGCASKRSGKAIEEHAPMLREMS
jgi:hypothetical protein